MRRVNQKKLNEDVMAYCDIAWGIKEEREKRQRPVLYRNIDLVSGPQTPNGRNPIVMCKDATYKAIGHVVKVEKQPHWFIRLLRKVIGIK